MPPTPLVRWVCTHRWGTSNAVRRRSAVFGCYAPAIGAWNTALTSAAKPASGGDVAVLLRAYTPCST